MSVLPVIVLRYELRKPVRTPFPYQSWADIAGLLLVVETTILMRKDDDPTAPSVLDSFVEEQRECTFRQELSPCSNLRARADHGHPTCAPVTREPYHISSRSPMFPSYLPFKCGLASLNFFFDVFSKT